METEIETENPRGGDVQEEREAHTDSPIAGPSRAACIFLARVEQH